MAATNKLLADSNKSGAEDKATKERERLSALVSSSARDYSYEDPLCASAARRNHDCRPRQCR